MLSQVYSAVDSQKYSPVYGGVYGPVHSPVYGGVYGQVFAPVCSQVNSPVYSYEMLRFVIESNRPVFYHSFWSNIW